MLTEREIEMLLQEATKVREEAYAPYSNFAVGAAILADSGKIYSGCNMENASYGLSICAERNALGQAISRGERQFRAIAVVAEEWPLPCGACRQVLAEFGDMTVLVARSDDPEYRRYLLPELLPAQFTLNP